MNQIILIGNVGNIAEIKQIGENKVISLSIATNKNWIDDLGIKQQKTEWHNVYTWDLKKIDLIEKYVKKGDKICVIGELLYNSETLSGGKVIKHATINIQKIELL